jgi:metal-responsive CopG/Arc/MetJ family transcriptional regulator
MKPGSSSLSRHQLAELRRLLAQHEKKAKASISLSGELLRAADAVAGKSARSALVERAVRRYLEAMVRRSRREHDLTAINAHAVATNRESDGLLELEAWPE